MLGLRRTAEDRFRGMPRGAIKVAWEIMTEKVRELVSGTAVFVAPPHAHEPDRIAPWAAALRESTQSDWDATL